MARKLPMVKGGKAGPATAVTPASLSRQAGVRAIRLPLGDFTQNTTTKFSRGAVGFPCEVVGAYLSARTKPAGGTLSVRVVVYDASANAEVNITETLDPETLTNREALAFSLATTNPAEIAADDTFEIHTIASDATVTQQQVDGYVVVLVVPSEDTGALVETAE